MKIAFQADANLDPDIIRGLRRREPSIDFQYAAEAIRDGANDGEVLRIAADCSRVLVTCDVRTMLVHFKDLILERESPGVILIPSSRSMGDVIEGLLLIWLLWTAEDIRNQVRWLP